MSERKQSRLTAPGFCTLPRRPCLDGGLGLRFRRGYERTAVSSATASLSLGLARHLSLCASRSAQPFPISLCFPLPPHRRSRAAFSFVFVFSLLLFSLQPLPRGEDAKTIDGQGMRFVCSVSEPETVARAARAEDGRARRCVVATGRVSQTSRPGEN